MTKKFLIVASIPFIMLLLAAVFHLRLNTSRSMPIGFYHEIKKNLERGDLVEVCLPKNLNLIGLKLGYIAGGSCAGGAQPVVKEVAGLYGDVVNLKNDRVTINGKTLPHSKTLTIDEVGRVIPAVARTTYTLHKDDVWLYGNSDFKSWDSRYYGVISQKNIVSVLKAEWVFN